MIRNRPRQDINDLHQAEGIFAVQRIISNFLRGLA
jgi:hypothetical protein